MYQEQDIYTKLLFIMTMSVVVAAMVFLISSVKHIFQTWVSVAVIEQMQEQPFSIAVEELVSPQAQYTLARKRAWQEAMEQLIQVSHKVVVQPHVSYNFDACFLQDNACVVYSKGYRDEFRKVTFYFAPSSQTRPVNHISFYLSLEDGQLPIVMMRTSYVGDSWLHIKSVALLADSEVILNEVFSEANTRREVAQDERSIVYEFSDVIMNERIDVIERIAQAQTLAVRIDGSHTDAYLEEPAVTLLQRQAGEVLQMYLLMNTTLSTALEQVTAPEVPVQQSDEEIQIITDIEQEASTDIVLVN